MEAQLYGSSTLAADLFMLNVTPIVNASLLFSGVLAVWPDLKRKVERLHQDHGREVRASLAGSCSAATVRNPWFRDHINPLSDPDPIHTILTKMPPAARMALCSVSVAHSWRNGDVGSGPEPVRREVRS